MDLHGKGDYSDILDSIESLNGCVINLSLESLKVSNLFELEFGSYLLFEKVLCICVLFVDAKYFRHFC